MVDLKTLPIPAGALAAGALWAGVSIAALGPLVADRTIGQSGWAAFCERNLRVAIVQQIPSRKPLRTRTTR